MDIKEKILKQEFEKRGLSKGWISKSKEAVLDAMEIYAQEKLSLHSINNNGHNIHEVLEFKEKQLQEVLNLQNTQTNKSVLNELDKNEIEIISQISILRFLLSESKRVS